MTTSAAVAQIDALLATAVSHDVVTGVAAMAADRQGITFATAEGERWSIDTVTWLGSLAQPIVAVGALQLAERGVLTMDEPIGDLLPDLADPQVLEGFDDDGSPRVRPARGTITLRRLLSHTAGNSYHFWNADIRRYQEVVGLPGIGECREDTLRTPLVFDPGRGWEYGMNIDWVGKAIETATGTDLDTYLTDHLLGPLGMRDTGFVLTAQRRARLAGVSFRTLDGLVPVEFEVNQEPEFQPGGDGMYGTPADYVTFTRMLLGNGELNGVRVLGADTMAEAMRNQIGDFSVGALISADPLTSFDVEFLPGLKKKWGLLGLLNMAETSAGRSPGSVFWAGMANCYFWVDRDRGDTGVFFTQVLPFADPEVLALFDRFETAVHRR